MVTWSKMVMLIELRNYFRMYLKVNPIGFIHMGYRRSWSCSKDFWSSHLHNGVAVYWVRKGTRRILVWAWEIKNTFVKSRISLCILDGKQRLTALTATDIHKCIIKIIIITIFIVKLLKEHCYHAFVFSRKTVNFISW